MSGDIMGGALIGPGPSCTFCGGIYGEHRADCKRNWLAEQAKAKASPPPFRELAIKKGNLALPLSSFLATTIVETLRRRGPLPLGYLAKITGRGVAEISTDLKELQREGIVKMECQGEDCLVTLQR